MQRDGFDHQAQLAIQQLAGHDDLHTTLGYMHLAPGETMRAIALLDKQPHGNVVATDGAASGA